MIETVPGETSVVLAALLDGAAAMSREGNHRAAIAALLPAVGLAPHDRTAHRRLAAAYVMAGDRASARSLYDGFIARLEAHGSFDAAVLERAYADAVLAEAARPLVVTTPIEQRRLTRDQSVALGRVAIAIIAITVTFGAMFAAGAQIFASGGPLQP